MKQYLDTVRDFYERAPVEPSAAAAGYRSLLAHYFNLLIPADASVLEIGCGSGVLLGEISARRRVGVDLSERQVAAARLRVPGAEFHVQAGESLSLAERFDCIVVSDTLNLAADVKELLSRLHSVSHPGTRLLINYHSNVWRPILSLAGAFGLRSRQPQSSWLATSDVRNLLDLADWEFISTEARLLCPVPIPVIAPLFNRVLAPLLGWFCLTVFVVARPRPARAAVPANPSVSVIIPARNEAGNIAAAIERTPAMGSSTEFIFVEGGSTDGTWEEIRKVAAANPGHRIKCLQQTGHGKGDAVRAGFEAASGEILMILDADLTVPPEELPKFHEVIASGHAEVANGVRLVYPMEDRAMPFLNLCANKAFSLAFTWLLGQPLKDTLCGTKAISRANYAKLAGNRGYFGEFDPFGDFDLLFGAAKLGLKIADVPIRYRERSYGRTNIHRWSHGWLLVRMVFFAMRRIKFV